MQNVIIIIYILFSILLLIIALISAQEVEDLSNVKVSKVPVEFS